MKSPEQSLRFGAVGLKIVSEKVCVVYHDETGDIIHVHRVVNLEGSKSPAPQEVETHAIELALAKRDASDRSHLKTMFAEPEHYAPSAKYKVDLQNMRIV